MSNQQPNQQFNQPPQFQETVPKPKFNLKYILIALILVVIVAGGVLAYQYWWLPKQETKLPEITIQDETASWQTYRNEEYGFEIKYPVNEFIISDNDYLSICGDENFENLLSENNKFCFQLASKNRSNIVGYEFLPFYIVSIVGRNSEYQSAESYYAAKEKERINREPCGGCRGLYFDLEYLNKRWDTGGTPGVCDNYDYLTWSNKKEMVLAVSDCGQEPAEHLGLRDLFNQNQSDYSLIQKILSNFKFIESNQTAGWQTYRNDFYEFEFRYPPNTKILEWGQTQGTNFPISNAIFVQKPTPNGGADNIFGILVPDKKFIKNSGEDYNYFITKPGVCGKWEEESEISAETIGIGSYSGRKVTEISPTEYPNRKTFSEYYCIAHPINPLIIFTPQGSEVGRQDEDLNYRLFDQILSSFKFIE